MTSSTATYQACSPASVVLGHTFWKVNVRLHVESWLLLAPTLHVHVRG